MRQTAVVAAPKVNEVHWKLVATWPRLREAELLHPLVTALDSRPLLQHSPRVLRVRDVFASPSTRKLAVSQKQTSGNGGTRVARTGEPGGLRRRPLQSLASRISRQRLLEARPDDRSRIERTGKCSMRFCVLSRASRYSEAPSALALAKRLKLMLDRMLALIVPDKS